jgi:hypothetical protein
MLNGTASSELPVGLKPTFSTLAWCMSLRHTRSYLMEPTPSKVPLLLRELYLPIKTSKALSLELIKRAGTMRK